jgi:hypothetical protein
MTPVLSGLHCVIASTYFDPVFLNLFGKGAVGRYHGFSGSTHLSSYLGQCYRPRVLNLMFTV